MPVDSEQLRRINNAVDFINENPTENFTLEDLAKIASYSPFHFQKLFKAFTGETPKKYILRVRLETAAHSLVMFRQKSVTEIALDFGFSSSATFARAFKNYFGISAQELRNTSEEKRLKLFLKGKRLMEVDKYFLNKPHDKLDPADLSDLSVKKIETITGIFINAPLDNETRIETALKKIARLAEVNDLLTGRTLFIGVINPHQNLYQAIATIETDQREIPRNLNLKTISAGKYAVMRIKGGIQRPFDTLHAFTKIWLPPSGYQLADIVSFEILSVNPLSSSYCQIEKDLHVPIEAAR